MTLTADIDSLVSWVNNKIGTNKKVRRYLTSMAPIR
jgi:hypothetical protein